MTGYRAFSYQFVKSFPVLSRGFEIETEMSIHAVENNMSIENVIIEYRDRPAGSESKLNTYSDGWKVLNTIVRLVKNYQPLKFFGTLFVILIIIAAILFISVFGEFFETGFVKRIPILIVSVFFAMAAVQSLFAGLILDAYVESTRKNFENNLQMVHRNFERDMDE